MRKLGHLAIDLCGQKFGRWTVLGLGEKTGLSERLFWKCKCECGNVRVVAGDRLRIGTTRSCGCFRAELSRSLYTKHGGYGSREYAAWNQLIQRCTNPKNPAFKRYGGRGIKVCERWREGFSNFIADMGPRPSPDHSIDRINNDGDYDPSNCRWADRKTQSFNRRPSIAKAAREARK